MTLPETEAQQLVRLYAQCKRIIDSFKLTPHIYENTKYMPYGLKIDPKLLPKDVD